MANAKNVFIIQHLQGYSGEEKYLANAERMTRAGFECCRSEKGEDGKYWEVWLGFPFMLKDNLHNASPESITDWIRRLGVGEITIAVQDRHYGLCIE